MEDLFAKLAISAVSLVGKAAFSGVSTLAVRQVSSYIQASQKTKAEQKVWKQLSALDSKFQIKLRIVTPSIELVEIIAARGNTSLAPILELTQPLRSDIMALTAKIASLSPASAATTGPASSPKELIEDLTAILESIDDLIPLLSLALTTSGAHLGNRLPDATSPSRLLQASAALKEAERLFDLIPEATSRPVLSDLPVKLYRLFTSSSRAKAHHDWTWKEEFALADARVDRVAPSSVFDYRLILTENLNDGRYHDPDQGEARAGTRVIPVQNIERLFYSLSGDILRIEDSQSPVLVLKICTSTSDREPLAGPSSATTTPAKNSRPSIEWLALELVVPTAQDEGDSDSDSDGDSETSSASSLASASEVLEPGSARDASVPAHDSTEDDDSDGQKGSGSDPGQDLSPRVSSLAVAKTARAQDTPTALTKCLQKSPKKKLGVAPGTAGSPLSLLEYILRLTTVESLEGLSHTSITDEKLFMYLSNDATPTPQRSTPTSRSSTLSLGLVSTVGIGSPSLNLLTNVDRTQSPLQPPGQDKKGRVGSADTWATGSPSQRVLGSPRNRKTFADKLRE